ncbi:hypothetical protein KUL72_20815 [Bradyrhizobium arachidis]|uniref:portal protein n=1 Tax=Bradyrhizobium arachidis TaxID=858423 RepID=UPI002161CF30|nr:portal protein [Bradyrhizobium arachidis]UVO33959.1 hypothetical protein KUL72_20815 [Bradyrhizobium arachidis]
MADYDDDKGAEPDQDKDDAPKSAQKAEWEKVHEEALLEYDRDYARERGNIDEAYEDLRFRRGRLEDQWDALALEQRKGRPCLVINKLPQFIRQVTGDMRQSRPGIKVVPVDSGADVETAEVRAGMIRYVENRSKAKHVYTTGADSQVTCGIGHWAVDTEYAHAGTFNQEIRVVGIEDGVSVLWDADSFLPTKSDADHCFVPSDMTMAKFKKDWPDAKADGFDTTLYGLGASSWFSSWASDDYIRVVKYWKKKPIKRLLALMPDGTIDDLTDQVKDAPKEEVQAAMEWLQRNAGARVEYRDSYKICRYLLTMAEVLEEQDWPGMHIPVVPVIGEEVRIGREVYRHGIVRYARDPQRMENYYASAETEVIALQPKAPWIGTKKQFQDNYDLWETANTEAHPFLEYTVDPQAPGPPQRVQPPVGSPAISEAKVRNSEDMKAVIGIYDASLGAKSNETSGIAIARRDAQGDTGTFVYHDNFALAIERTAEIINELFPKIYDTQRTVQILGDDGKPDMVEINKPQMLNGVNKVLNDMTAGAYDVVMEQGPNYATKREQAQDGMTEFIRAFPPAAPVMGDLYAKAMDWPNAEQIGERLEELLPPPIKAKMQADRQKREQAAGQPPSPEQQQEAAAQQQAQQQAQQAQAMQMAEAQAKVKEAEAKAEKAQADARKSIAEANRAEAEAQLLKVQLARSHMAELRTIEAHGEDMARGAASHAQDIQHKQDRHAIDLTVLGINTRRAGEKHDATIEQMKAPPEVAEAE